MDTAREYSCLIVRKDNPICVSLNWDFLGSSAGKLKGKTSHCMTFFPGNTMRHTKANVVQVWKPPIHHRKKSEVKKNYKEWYPDGRRYVFMRDNEKNWNPLK